MKKLFFIFIYLSYFILGNINIAIAQESYGSFTEVLETISQYKTDFNSFDNELIQSSLESLRLNIIDFYNFHKVILPVDYTLDSTQPFEAFDSYIIEKLNEQITLIKYNLTEGKDDPRSPNLTSQSIAIIDKIFDAAVNSILNFKDTNPLSSFSKARDYSPTHLYALLHLYIEKFPRFSDENLPKDNIFQSLDIFQYYLELDSNKFKGTFEDYFNTRSLPDSEYNREILEVLFKAQKT